MDFTVITAIISIVTFLLFVFNFIKTQYVDKAAEKEARVKEEKDLADKKAAEAILCEHRFSELEANVQQLKEVQVTKAEFAEAGKTQEHRFSDLEARIRQLTDNQVNKDEFAVVKNQIKLFWDSVSTVLAPLLHSPHTPELDILVDKMRDKTINYDEMARLLELLDTEVQELKQPHFPIDGKREIVVTLVSAGLKSQMLELTKGAH